MTVIDITGSAAANDIIADDIIQPFQLESSSLRGRLVRLGPALDDIISPHDYPEIVNNLLAELMSLGLLLTAMLKNEGMFTLQTSGDGPVSMLVADISTSGDIRACASYDENAVKNLKPEAKIQEILGKGYLAFTVDQTGDTERYQGIVELKGNKLLDCVQNYFDQSEQIGTAIKLAVGKHGGSWRSGAIMLQHMPEQGEYAKNKAEIKKLKQEKAIEGQDSSEKEDSIEEHWNRASILLGSCTDEELTAPGLNASILLTRLFHEEGVRVYTPINVTKKCRCSEEKIRNILKSLSKEDLEHAAKNGTISSQCEFCATEYVVSLDELSD